MIDDTIGPNQPLTFELLLPATAAVEEQVGTLPTGVSSTAGSGSLLR